MALGWRYAKAADIERADLSQVILRDSLLKALQRINSHIPTHALEQAADELFNLNEPSLIARNRRAHALLISGIATQCNQDNKQRNDWVSFIDFITPSNNDFLLVSQFNVIGNNKRIRRADLVAFVNGLPLAVIELKNPANEQADIWQAFD